MNEELKDLDKRVSWNKKHLRIVFILSVVNLLMLIGHFILHAMGRLPH